MILILMMRHLLTDVSPEVCLAIYPTVDEVEDGCHKDDPVGHLMLQVGLLLMSSMEMSTSHLEVHEDLDDPDVEEEGMTWSAVMLSAPMMKLPVMMDRWSSLLPGVGDGPQASCALLPCEMVWGILYFEFRDDSEALLGSFLSSSYVILVSMIIVADGRFHYRLSMIVMMMVTVADAHFSLDVVLSHPPADADVFR